VIVGDRRTERQKVNDNMRDVDLEDEEPGRIQAHFELSESLIPFIITPFFFITVFLSHGPLFLLRAEAPLSSGEKCRGDISSQFHQLFKILFSLKNYKAKLKLEISFEKHFWTKKKACVKCFWFWHQVYLLERISSVFILVKRAWSRGLVDP